MPRLGFGTGTARRRGGKRSATIRLSGNSVAENAATDTVVGTPSVVNGTAAGAITLAAQSNANWFKMAGGVLKVGSASPDRETNDKPTVTLTDGVLEKIFTINVSNVLEVTLGALALSGLSYTTGSSSSGSITGKTSGSTVSLSGSLPTGLTLDLTAMTWAWDGTGAVSTGSFDLIETHADGSNSPRTSSQSWAIVDAPAVSISTEFPVLKAAYEGGGRAIITQIGDSTTANAGTKKEEESVAQYIVNYLNDQGLHAIQGTFSNGDKGIASLLSWTPAQWGAFFNPDATYTGSWTLYAAGVATNMFGLGQFYSSTASDKISWTPGFAFDRVEHFHITFSGAGAYDVKIGATTLWNIDGNAANSIVKKTAVSVTRASTALDMIIASGTAWPGHFRVWDSTAGATVQVENLGVCNSTSGYWANSAGGTDPGNTIAALASHLYIINLGLNDQNTGVSAATFQSNLETLIQKCKDAGGDVLVCMPNTATDGHELDSAHRTAVTTACTNKSIAAPVDLRTGFNTGTMLADGVHPNAVGNSWIGYDKIGPRLLGL